MHTHEVEPLIFLCAWLEELDVAIAKVSEQTLIADIAHTIQSEFSSTFLQQNRFDRDFVSLLMSPIVVDQSGYLE